MAESEQSMRTRFSDPSKHEGGFLDEERIGMMVGSIGRLLRRNDRRQLSARPLIPPSSLEIKGIGLVLRHQAIDGFQIRHRRRAGNTVFNKRRGGL
jgi:hypothetical protein